jgi:hypothetical protein
MVIHDKEILQPIDFEYFQYFVQLLNLIFVSFNKYEMIIIGDLSGYVRTPLELIFEKN